MRAAEVVRWFILAVAICMAAVVYGQTFYGSVLGTVTDSSAAVVQGATVTLVNTGTSERRVAETDLQGGYRFVNLLPGSYRVEVEKPGFRKLVRDQIVVEVQAAVRIDVSLQVGEINQVIEVTGQTPILQTESTTLGQVVESRKLQEMPLNGRNVYNLIALVPGVTPTGGGGINVSIGGGMQQQNVAYLDGAPLNTGYFNSTAGSISQDAVQEFRVQTNSASAEFGRTAGGVINMTSRSGTNEFHGSAYEFLRNRVLNANTFFSNKASLARPPFTQNQFGGTIGGPIVRDKTFFFFSYEGFRQRQGRTFTLSTPVPEWRKGDFSNLRNSTGASVTIYDPLTVCGRLGNPACATGSTGAEVLARQPFPGNVIPTDRLDKTAVLLTPKIWGPPNQPGNAFTFANNFATNASAGSNNDQFNIRIDENLSDKQRIFGRYAQIRNTPLLIKPYGTITAGGAFRFTPTHQAVFGDTYTINPTTVFDVRLAYVHTENNRWPDSLGMDMTTIGWPASFNSQMQYRVLPQPNVAGFDGLNLFIADPETVIKARNHVYSLAPSLTKTISRHTLKFGMEMRVIQFNFTQTNSSGGTFAFDNVFTSVNPLAPAGSGFSFASYMLGYGTSGSMVMSAQTAGQERYQGYYVADTHQVTNRLTLNYGLRWELLGPWTERYDRLTVLLPDAVHPLAQPTGLPLKGKLALVHSDERPSRGNQNFPWRLFSPRFGSAFRMSDRTVIRAGFGLNFLPNDATFGLAAVGSPINNTTTPWVPSIDGGITPYATLNNPFPSGLIAPIGHDPAFQAMLYGASVTSPIGTNTYGYVEQWNLTIQRELGNGLGIEAAYAGSHGVHLPTYSNQLNQLPEKHLSMGSALLTQVNNPFYGLITSGTLAAKTVAQGQLLRPYPHYTGYAVTAAGNRNSIYHSLQTKLEKRFGRGATLLAAYTFSKFISDTENVSSWTESAYGGGMFQTQNWYNLRAERALSQGDAPHRLVLSYVLDLPVGKGKWLFGNVSGAADKLISGWGVNGITTFQSGFPISVVMSSNLSNSYNGTIWRPNSTGRSAALTGSAQSRLGKWFDTSAFTQPASFTFGNVSRTLPDVRTAGINNFDFTVFKDTALTERYKLQFRAEVFNLFNRVQFGYPGMSMGLPTFGVVSSQANTQRLVQMALRLSF